ncbi:MAG TPA: erythromycin esterase family protein [Thermoanaerobaculia bacterium]|nr:erythromycin esterase family protein [Thermoanaerobaculia bacterium]
MRSLSFALLLALACNTATAPEPVDLHPHPLTGEANDYDPLLQAIGGAHLVLLGEATHGTHEFYVERMRITQRLIREKRFTALALEAEWADAARVDRYVKGQSSDRTAAEALGGFEDFPRWMWRNEEFASLVEWIRQHNQSLPANAIKVGVYGLDLYGLEESREAVQRHLTAIDPQLAAQVKTMKVPQQVEAIRARRLKATDKRMLDELFSAEQNARVVRNAEEYYREQSRGHVSTWNLRDKHMVATMDELQRYLLQRNGHDNIAVWAHNSHVGDARATARARFGEWNMGQLVREHWPAGASFTVGFMTNTGTVMAADAWDSPPRIQQLRPSLRGSHGALFHEVGLPRFLVLLGEIEARAVRTPRQQRAVGVVYLPHAELDAHYYTATLREQFDAVVHIDETRALTPL